VQQIQIAESLGYSVVKIDDSILNLYTEDDQEFFQTVKGLIYDSDQDESFDDAAFDDDES